LKIANIIAVLLFLYAAVVQYNDPDPFLWIAIYVGVAGLSAAGIFERYWPVPSAVLATLCLAGSAYLAFRVLGKQSLIDSEEGREMLGLLIVGIWSGILFVTGRGKGKSSQSTG